MHINRESKYYAYTASLVSFLAGLLLLSNAENYVSTAWLSTSMRVIGSFLSISVVVSFMYSLFIKPYDDASNKKQLEILLDKKLEDITVGKIKYGFDGLVEAMDFHTLFKSLNANQTLWWLDTCPLGAGAWMEEVKSAIMRGVNIKILVLNPSSTNVTHRANELEADEYSPQQLKNEIEAFIARLKALSVNNAFGSLQVAQYDELIGMPCYIVTEGNDRRPVYGYSSFFLSNPTAIKVPHFKWGVAQESILRSMTSYLTEKWERNSGNIILNTPNKTPQIDR